MTSGSTIREPIRTREVSWAIIVLFLLVSMGLIVGVLAARNAGLLATLLRGPMWAVNLVLFGSLLLVAVGGVVFQIGRLRPAELGLGWRRLREGLLVIGGIWLIIQIFAAIEGAATDGLALDRAWSTAGVLRTVTWAAVMFLVTATYEEIAFRGFLFPQLYLKFRGSHRMRFWTAMLVSQAVFAAAHLPAHVALRHLSGSALWTQMVLQGVAGVLLVLVYLRTRNLWIGIGFHGLANAPTPIFRGATSWEIFLLLLLIIWPWITRRQWQRGLARVERLPDDAPETRMSPNDPTFVPAG